MAHWIESVDTSDPRYELGRLVFTHVHDDGSQHSATLKTSSTFWGGPHGELPEGVSLTCSDCGETAVQDADIRLVF